MMMARRILVLLLLAILAVEARAQSQRGPFKKIAVIHLKDESNKPIDTSVKVSVLRRISEARAWGADCVIFDIESYGGYVGASMETGQEILELGSNIHTIAYVHRRAISGAAMLSLACREIVMSEVASIGDSQVVTSGSAGDQIVASEKSQTVVAAEFRKYAERNGYPVALAEAMVRQDMEVFSYSKPVDPEDASKGEMLVFFAADELPDMVTVESQRLSDQKIVVRPDRLATFHANEAVRYQFASRLLPTVDALITEISNSETQMQRFEWSGSERFSRWLLSMRSWLFLLGALAAYIAFKTPGTGVPEVLAIVLFGLYFGASAIVGLADMWEILLFAVGIGLILVEIFILPGFGVAGFLGLACVLVSLALVAVPSSGGTDQYGSPIPKLIDFAGSFVAGTLGATFIMFFLARYLPSVPIFGRLALEAPDANSAMASQAPTTPSPLVGATGTAVSDLRPAGRALIDGHERDVVTEGEYVESGEDLRVIEVRGAIIIVRPQGSQSA